VGAELRSSKFGKQAALPSTFIPLALFMLLTACSSPSSDIFHGYVEGEFVYVASPLPGVVTLNVTKGGMVKKGDPLFALESDAEKSSRDEAERRLSQARSALQDVGKGLRPTEIAALKAQYQLAGSALNLAEIEYGRQEKLFRSAVVSAQSLDSARATRDQQLQSVARIEADLKTATLGARSDQIAGAEANVKALEAVLARAEWELAQKSRRAPEVAVVYDTLYRSGEWVAAGKPVVSLLPPAGRKVRVFVPEQKLASIHANDPVSVTADGTKGRFSGRVSFISPRAEYTPPVIYSRESRSKLVYLVEATFPPESGFNLHPGQPVDLTFRR
jgi:HlyD family secretion protein